MKTVSEIKPQNAFFILMKRVFKYFRNFFKRIVVNDGFIEFIFMIHQQLRKLILISLLLFFCAQTLAQKLIHYDLYVNDTTLNYSGVNAKAIAINGQIPAPQLTLQKEIQRRFMFII